MSQSKMEVKKMKLRFHRKLVVRLLIISCMFVASCVCTYAAIDETEPNNLISQANKISVGETVYGKYGNGEYSDYYKFTAPVSGTVKIRVWHDNPADTSNLIAMNVFNSHGNLLSEFFAGNSMLPEGDGSTEFPVIAGKTYYISFEGKIGFDVIQYHFKTLYSVGRTSISSLKGNKKSLTVKWHKKSGASFYQIQHTPKSTYDKYNWTKAKTVKASAKSKSKKIKKLRRFKKYCVRVRVVRVIEGKTYYSPWSTKKVVRVK